MNRKVLLIAAGGLAIGAAGYYAMQKANTVQNLTWQFAKVQLDKKNTGFSKIALAVTVRVTNPTRGSVSFDRFNANLRLKGNLLSTVFADKSTHAIVIAPGTTDIIFTAWIDTLGVLLSLPGIAKQIIAGGFRDLINVSGTLYAGGITIPVSSQIGIGFGNTPSVGKARVSFEFDNNEAAAEYFQKSHMYVSSNGSGGKAPGYSMN